MLTKKVYKALAEIIATQPTLGITKADLVENLVAWLRLNPNFDQEKFENACCRFDKRKF